MDIQRLPVSDKLIQVLERLSIMTVSEVALLPILSEESGSNAPNKTLERLASELAAARCRIEPVYKISRTIEVTSRLEHDADSPAKAGFRTEISSVVRIRFPDGELATRVSISGETADGPPLNLRDRATQFSSECVSHQSVVEKSLWIEPEMDPEAFLRTKIRFPLLDRVLNGAGDARTREILIRRHGLRTGRVETLESIGQDLGITRERVRQLQSKAMRRLVGRATARKGLLPGLHRFRRHLSSYLDEMKGIASESEISDEFDGYLCFDSYETSRGLAFLAQATGLVVKHTDEARIRWIAYSDEDKRTRMIAAAEVALDPLVRRGPQELLTLSQKAAERLGVTEQEVIAALRVDPRVEIKGSEVVQVHYRDRKLRHRDRAIEILKSIGKPAHFRTVGRRIRQNYTDAVDVSDNTIENLLVDGVPVDFRRVGLGTYGLAEWGLPSAVNSVDLVRQILEEHRRWLSVQELYLKMKAVGWQVKETSVKMALDLENDRPRRVIRKVSHYGRVKYGLAGWNRPDG